MVKKNEQGVYSDKNGYYRCFCEMMMNPPSRNTSSTGTWNIGEQSMDLTVTRDSYGRYRFYTHHINPDSCEAEQKVHTIKSGIEDGSRWHVLYPVKSYELPCFWIPCNDCHGLSDGSCCLCGAVVCMFCSTILPEIEDEEGDYGDCYCSLCCSKKPTPEIARKYKRIRGDDYAL